MNPKPQTLAQKKRIAAPKRAAKKGNAQKAEKVAKASQKAAKATEKLAKKSKKNGK